MDTYYPRHPTVKLDKPFLMPDRRRVHHLRPRHRGYRPCGTRHHQASAMKSKSSVSSREPRRRPVTGVEMFRKLLDEGEAGDNIGCSAPRHRSVKTIERGQVVGQARHRFIPHTKFAGSGVRPEEGRRRPSYPVLQQLSSAVLFPHDGRDRCHHAAGRHRDGACPATTSTWTLS